MTPSAQHPEEINLQDSSPPDVILGDGAPEVIPETEIPEEVVPPEIGPRDAANWAKQITRLSVDDVPEEAVNRNVAGRRVMSPIQGFGKMWQKTYRVKLDGIEIAPEEVIATWKQNFPSFWPENNRFFGPLTGIAPGEVAVLNLTMPGRLKLSTGVLVLYADEESFTLMTPQGHMFAGWITFSAFQRDGSTFAQAQVLMRANDPMYETGLAFGGHKKEDQFWEHTLRSLARHLGAAGEFEAQTVCVDKKRQWRRAGNIWHNAAIRSGFYAMGAPARTVGKALRRS